MTTTIDRTKAPDFRVIDSIDLIKADTYELKNGQKIYFINAGSQDVCRIEFLFDAGSWHQSKPLTANAAGKLAQEGTSLHTSSELATSLDFYGAFLETKVDRDFASITLYSLNKHLADTLPIVKEILTEAIFPESELKTFKQREKQALITNLKKVSYLASVNFLRLLFGGEHPYGYSLSVEDIENLDRESIYNFYDVYYSNLACDIVLSGKIGKPQLDLMEEYFGGGIPTNVRPQRKHHTAHTSKEKQHFIHRDDAIQSAIKIGMPTIGKEHPDFHKLTLVNTILGGYFGSRLMTNIREDKGYTYGIGSGLVTMLDGAYFVISTEVGSEVCNDALQEIYKEIGRLKTEPVGVDELNTVKNFMIGRFQRNTDGPFAWADAFIALKKFGLGYDHYLNFFDAVRSMQANDVQEIANKYFTQESLLELVVGKK